MSDNVNFQALLVPVASLALDSSLILFEGGSLFIEKTWWPLHQRQSVGTSLELAQ